MAPRPKVADAAELLRITSEVTKALIFHACRGESSEARHYAEQYVLTLAQCGHAPEGRKQGKAIS